VSPAIWSASEGRPGAARGSAPAAVFVSGWRLSRPDPKARHHVRDPPPPQHLVLLLKTTISIPAHAGRFRWELVLGLHGALPHIVEPVRDSVDAMHSALRRVLISGGVFQTKALPASKISATKYPAAAAPTLEAHEPLPPAAEPGRRICEGHELLDAAPLTV